MASEHPSAPNPVACLHQPSRYKTSQMPLSRTLLAGVTGLARMIAAVSVIAVTAAQIRPLLGLGGVLINSSCSSSASSGLQPPQDAATPVDRMSLAMDALPSAHAADTVATVTPAHLQIKVESFGVFGRSSPRRNGPVLRNLRSCDGQMCLSLAPQSPMMLILGHESTDGDSPRGFLGWRSGGRCHLVTCEVLLAGRKRHTKPGS